MAALPSMSQANSWRVKLYQLNEDGQWDDRGTGQIRVAHVDALGAPGVHVVSEETGVDLLQSRIVEDREAYSLQGENIITWEERRAVDGEEGPSVDLALSFQENEGCLQIWNQIQEVQGRFASQGGGGAAVMVGGGGADNRGSPALDDDDDGGAIRGHGMMRLLASEAVGGVGMMGAAQELKALPECRLANAEAIRDQLNGASPMHRSAYANMLLESEGDYLKKLSSMFGDCEDLEDAESLKVISHTMRAVVLLNDGRLLEHVLTDEALYESVVGALEYDPELTERATTRRFLKDEARFREAVPMDKDPELRAKIKQTFRAVLLRDAIMRPGMDDSAVSGLVQFIYFAYSDILSRLFTNSDYLRRVVAVCAGRDPALPTEHNQTQALLFLQEMYNIAKASTVSMQTRDSLFTYMLNEVPTFEALRNVLMMHQRRRNQRTARLLAAASAGGARGVAGVAGGGELEVEDEFDATTPARERLAATEVLASVVAVDSASTFRAHVVATGNHPPSPAWWSNQNGGSSSSQQSKPPPLQPSQRFGLRVSASLETNVDPMETSSTSASAAESSSADATTPSNGAGGASAMPHDGSLSSSESSSSSSNSPASSASSSSSASPQQLSSSSSAAASSPTNILTLVLYGLAHDTDTGVLMHYNEVVFKCIDTEGLDASERDGFLAIFYDHYIQWLVDPFVPNGGAVVSSSPTASAAVMAAAAPGKAATATAVAEASGDAASMSAAAALSSTTSSSSSSSSLSSSSSSSSSSSASSSSSSSSSSSHHPVPPLTDAQKASRGHACDLLSHCVKTHTYRMKYFVLRNNIVGRVLELLKYDDKFLKLAALRFVRACVGVKDDFLNRHFVKKDHLTPVFALFVANHPKDNLISSAIIDLVEYIRTENIKSLVEHIVDKFTPCFEGVEHVTTFKALVLKHEQNLELRSASRHDRGGGGGGDGRGMSGAGTMSAIAAAEWRKARELDDDEAYFEKSDDSDDNDETTSTSAHASGSPLSGSAGILALERMGGAGGASSDSSNAISSGDDASDTSDDGDSLTGGFSGRSQDSPPNSPSQSLAQHHPQNAPQPPTRAPSPPPLSSSSDGLGGMFEGMTNRVVASNAPVRMTMRINTIPTLPDGDGADADADSADDNDDDASDDGRSDDRRDRSPSSAKRQKRDLDEPG